MPIIRGIRGNSPALRRPLLQRPSAPPAAAPSKPSSPFVKGYQNSQKEAGKNSDFNKELRFGGKHGITKGKTVQIVFFDPEPISYYTHNMFNVGKKGYLTCAGEGCLLCAEKIDTMFRSSWRVFLMNDNGSIEMKYFSRGKTELTALAKLASDLTNRCEICGAKMLVLGGKKKCSAHPKAVGSKLTDWVFDLAVTGEQKDTKWNFDRDVLVPKDLRAKLDMIAPIDLEKILAPKSEEYLKKVTADLHVADDEIDAGADLNEDGDDTPF